MTIAAKIGASLLAPFMAFGGGNHGSAPNAPVHDSHASFWSGGNIDMTKFFGTKAHAQGTNAKIKITGVDGPTTLAVNETGTWTVNVSSRGNASPLQYSVKWGDEGTMMSAARMNTTSTSSATFTHAYDASGTYTPVFTVTDAKGRTVSVDAASVQVGASVAHIDSLSPASGPAGTVVTLSGSNFGSSTAVRFDGGTVSTSTVQNSSSITFTVPSNIAAGSYRVWVTDDNGASNVVRFNVTAPATGRLSVNGVDAPTTLTIGEDGTWTVHAATNVSGSLHYSVVWGDENMMARAMSAIMPDTTQTSATFTHAYDAAGTYQPTFTITDDAGHTVSTSASVRVTDQ